MPSIPQVGISAAAVASTPTSTSASAPAPKSVARAPCTVENCPLNEAKIPHSQGIYKHNGQDALGLCFIFANSNPPGFVWRAWEQYADLERAIRKGQENGEDSAGLKIERDQKGDIIDRFLDNHCSCNKCEEGGKH